MSLPQGDFSLVHFCLRLQNTVSFLFAFPCLKVKLACFIYLSASVLHCYLFDCMFIFFARISLDLLFTLTAF